MDQMSHPVTGIEVEKNGVRYKCDRIHDHLYWCGCCGKGKLRIQVSRHWERTDDHCRWCGARLASIKSF